MTYKEVTKAMRAGTWLVWVRLGHIDHNARTFLVKIETCDPDSDFCDVSAGPLLSVARYSNLQLATPQDMLKYD